MNDVSRLRTLLEVKLNKLTIEDVRETIRSLNNDKVTGTDAIHTEMLKVG